MVQVTFVDKLMIKLTRAETAPTGDSKEMHMMDPSEDTTHIPNEMKYMPA